VPKRTFVITPPRLRDVMIGEETAIAPCQKSCANDVKCRSGSVPSVSRETIPLSSTCELVEKVRRPGEMGHLKLE
jgi:hypothetical protein